MKVLVIFLITVFAITSYLVSDADARCSMGYPCKPPISSPISAEMAFRSDIIVSGFPVQKHNSAEVLTGYEKNNPSNPCGLGLQYAEPNQGIVDFLNNSTHKAPFLYEFKVEKIYKNHDANDIIRIIGIERIHDRHYAESMSYGYKFTPELGEKLLLYLKHFDEFSFGTNCKISDVYLVEKIQGSLWEWNKEDYVPDIYPGDVKIPPLKEQRAFQYFEKNKEIVPAVYDLISCPLGMEPMYRLYVGSPFCVTSDTADKIEQRGWAKRFSYFWTFDGLQYKHTENYEIWKKVAEFEESFEDDDSVEPVTRCKGEALCLTEKITRIIDGDTLYLGDYKIRLSLTNTPERHEIDFHDASKFTAETCPVGTVALVDQDDLQPYDVYDRVLGKVVCGNKVLNSELLYTGHANILTQYCNTSEFSEEAWAQEFGC